MPSGHGEAMFGGEEGRAGPAGHANLGVDVRTVMLDRAMRDAEQPGHVLIGTAVGDEAEDLDLPIAQARGPGAGAGVRRRTRGVEDVPDSRAVELAAPRFFGEHLGGRVVAERRSMGPV